MDEIRLALRRVERVLEQDRMPRIDTERKLAKGVDDLQVETVRDGDKARFLLRIDCGNGGLVARVDLHDTGFLKNDLRLEIAHAGNLVGDRVPTFLGGEDAHGFFPAELMAHTGEGRTTASFVGERVVSGNKVILPFYNF